MGGGLNGGLNEGQQRVYQFIRENEGVKVKDISITLDIPKQIKVLVSKGLIERRGSKKTGGYYIVGK